jgi:hypothetical protein
MKRIFYLMGFPMAALVMLLISCDEDNGEPDPLVGTYTFAAATFNDSVQIIISDVPVDFTPGSDASGFVGPGLLAAAPCDNPENAVIELMDDGTTWFTCLNETNQEQMGTWSIKSDRSVLTLYISNPRAFSLTATDLVETETSFAGTVELFPLPKDAGVELGSTLPGGLPNFQTASVDIKFNRID